MDDRKFRRSKNVEDRTDEPPAGEPSFADAMSAKFAKDDWLREAEKNPRDRNDLAIAAGADSLKKQSDAQVGRGDMLPVSAAQPLMSSSAAVQQAIVQAAREHGENPAYALAVAQRESNFDPNAKSSKTIRGMYQMRGDLREKYGVGDSVEPPIQTAGWLRSLPDIRSDMKSVLGRDPSDQEAYLGHHFGSKRAARMLKMAPSTPTDTVFTPQEMGLNPHFAHAGTVGKLNGSVMGDISRRMAGFGKEPPGPAPEPADLSGFGTPPLRSASSEDAPSMPAASSDLSSFGTLTSLEPSTSAPAAPSAPDLSTFGTPVA